MPDASSWVRTGLSIWWYGHSMAVKVTFTLDETTVKELSLSASRLSKPKSEIVREAIHEHHLRSDRLSESERRRMLKVLEEYMPTRGQAEVDRELRELRASRRKGWRRPSDLR